MRALWTDAGLVDVDTREIRVQRTFADFDAFWKIAQSGPRLAPRFAAMGGDERSVLKDRVRARFEPGPGGAITCSASANAVRGRVPG